jgi:hypothetical protein
MNVVNFLVSTVRRSRRLAQRRVHTIDVIDDDTLWVVLDQFGWLQSLDAGVLRCPVTGEILTRDRVGGMLVIEGKAMPVSYRGLWLTKARENA